MSSNNQFRISPRNPHKKSKANDNKSGQKIAPDVKDPLKFVFNNPHIKTKTIINPRKKGSTHLANAGSLFAKSVGDAIKRKKCAERDVDLVEDQQNHGHNCSFVPPRQNTSGGHSAEHRTESTQHDAKPSTKTLNKHQIFTSKEKNLSFRKNLLQCIFNREKTSIGNEKMH